MSQPLPEERSGSTFPWYEDWSAATVGLVLIALVLLGVIPDRLVP
ncbi:hypothetical protein [Nocardia sp. R6R-6]